MYFLLPAWRNILTRQLLTNEECCFRVRFRVRICVNPNSNLHPKTAFFFSRKKKKEKKKDRPWPWHPSEAPSRWIRVFLNRIFLLYRPSVHTKPVNALIFFISAYFVASVRVKKSAILKISGFMSTEPECCIYSFLVLAIRMINNDWWN